MFICSLKHLIVAKGFILQSCTTDIYLIVWDHFLSADIVCLISDKYIFAKYICCIASHRYSIVEEIRNSTTVFGGPFHVLLRADMFEFYSFLRVPSVSLSSSPSPLLFSKYCDAAEYLPLVRVFPDSYVLFPAIHS